MPIYSKPYLSLPDQLAKLKSRGLKVTDDDEAIQCLHRNGYYRLSAYWYLFRQINLGERSDKFLDDSYFNHARDLYVFDKRIKLLLLDAIERIEIAVRVEISLQLGKIDPFAYTNPRLFHTAFTTLDRRTGRIKHREWLIKFDAMVARSRDEFVLHHKRKYGDTSPLPIWIAIELWDFGMLSHLFSGMKVKDRELVSSRFMVPDWQLMESWLRCLNYVRNVIAHHGRLWNLSLADNPKLPTMGLMPEFDMLLTIPNVNTRLYSICCILSHLSRVINPSSTWTKQLVALVVQFPAMPHANIHHMGFPANWQGTDFWK